jgi:3',5'-cyclic AMP phosphodiesterase CpdA
MALFRLLHASDFHISQAPFSFGQVKPVGIRKALQYMFQTGHNDQCLAAFAHYVNRVKNEEEKKKTSLIHGYIFTGDLAATGYNRDLSRAFDFLTQSNSDNQIGMIQNQIGLVPGNHDRYGRGLFHLEPGGQVFVKPFLPRHEQIQFHKTKSR